MFIYLLNGKDGGGVYVPRERVIEISPVYSEAVGGMTRYVVRYDRCGEIASGNAYDLEELIEARHRMPAPAGMEVGGRPVLYLELEGQDMGSGCQAAVYHAEAGEIRLTPIPVLGEAASATDEDAVQAVAEATEAASGRKQAKA